MRPSVSVGPLVFGKEGGRPYPSQVRDRLRPSDQLKGEPVAGRIVSPGCPVQPPELDFTTVFERRENVNKKTLFGDTALYLSLFVVMFLAMDTMDWSAEQPVANKTEFEAAREFQVAAEDAPLQETEHVNM